MPHGTDKRTCESCGGAMPPRTHRSRNAEGKLVCDSCGDGNAPRWQASYRGLSIPDAHEMQRREAQAIASIVRVRKALTEGISVVAHDSGDNAIINHCPFCGSGAVTGGSDGTAACDFCHSAFTVQVQPIHPYMPQTVDGQPLPPPGMPGGQETELSAPTDPTVEEQGEDVAADPLGDAETAPGASGNGPVAPGQPPSKQPPWLKNKSSRTAMEHWKKGDRVNTGRRGDGTVTRSNGTSITIECDNGEILNMLVGSDAYKALTAATDTKQAFRTADAIDDLAERNWEVLSRALTRLARHHGISYAEAKERFGHLLVRPEGAQYNLVTEESVKALLGEKQAFRTADGRTLDAEAYMARLALEHADDRDEVLDAVRLANVTKESITWDTYGVKYSDGTPASVNDIVQVPGISEQCHVTQMDTSRPDVIWVQPASQWAKDWEPGDPRPRKVQVKSVTPIETVYQHFKHQPGPPSLGSKQAVDMQPCPRCDGNGEIPSRPGDITPDTTWVMCPRCKGLGDLDADHPENFDLREPPHQAVRRDPFSLAAEAASLTVRVDDRRRQYPTLRVWVNGILEWEQQTAKDDADDEAAYLEAHKEEILASDSGPRVAIDRLLSQHHQEKWGSRQAASGLVKHEIAAEEIQVGDRLDANGRTRVSKRHPRTDKVLVQTKTTGTRSPSIKQWENGETVTVWRQA